MAHRTLELTLISAKDLKDVNLFSKMNAYAVVTIAGDHRTQQRTPIDREGGKNPTWNTPLRFSIPAEPSAAARLVIDILIRSARAFGDRDVGEVHILIKDFLDGFKAGSKFVSYQVRKPHSSKAKGVLNLSYKFIDLPAATALPPPIPTPAVSSATYPPPGSEKPPKENEPVMAFPAPAASWSPYPPPPYPPAGGYQPYPPQGGYPSYPPPPAYGAPAMGYGYGAPQPGGYGYAAVPPKRKNNNLGLGLGAGLLGGALGGMLIGDMFSDADSYDAGYDAGFDDGSGF